MPLCRPDAEWPKIWSVLAVPSLQLIQKLSERTLTKSQSLNSLLTLDKHYIQLLLIWFHFLDLLIKLMKMMLLYILYCPRTSATWVQGSLVPLAILHAPVYRSSTPPPPFRPISGEGRGDPSVGHVFGWHREGGDRCKTTTCGMAKDTKRLHLSRWYLTCRMAKDRIILCFFETFFIMSKS